MESFHLHRGFIRQLTGSAGFTLVELMVVLAIIVTITSVALTSQSSFNKSLVLANTAYDVALTLRSAESFGIGSRARAGTTNAGYGVRFREGSSIVLFADTSPDSSCTRPDCRPGDYAYSAGDDVLVQAYTLGNGITVSDFCAFSGSWQCGLDSLDIVFARPNPDAFMSANGSYSEIFPITKACITLTSPHGGYRFISVAVSGAITANASSDPSSCHGL